MAKDLAIILNNGSINSAVATALAVQKYRPVLLHVEAAPTPGSRARAAYDQQVAHFKQVGFKFGRWVDVTYWQRIL